MGGGWVYTSEWFWPVFIIFLILAVIGWLVNWSNYRERRK